MLGVDAEMTRCRMGFGALAAAAIALMVSVATAQAAPPANDDYANASVIAGKLPVQVDGTDVDATKEAGEPDHGGDSGGTSVWYSWTAAATGPVQIHTCNGPTLDTLLGVYTATGAVPPFTNLQQEAANDDLCAHGSLVEVQAVEGTTYRIAVDSFSGLGPPATGPFTLRISGEIPRVAIDSGPGIDSNPRPTWTFRTFGAGGPVSVNCTIFKESPVTPGMFIAYLEQPGCSSPFTPGTALTEGNYVLEVVATASTGEVSLGTGERQFTIRAAETAPPAAAPIQKPKRCKKGKRLKGGKCVKKKKRGKLR
jgi:hypothetical protein